MRIGALFSLAIVIGIFFFLDWSVVQSLIPLLKAFNVSEIGQQLYWVTNIGLPVLFFGSMLFIGRSSFTTATLGSIFISLFITKIIFLFGLLIGEFVELISHGFQYLSFSENTQSILKNPELFKTQIAASIAAVPFFAFLYGITKGKYNYTLHEHEILFPDLPDAFDGFTITQISDVHSGGFHNQEEVAKGIKMINDQQSDLFVFTGDLVNNQATEIEPWINLFKTIEAPFGKYSILGNHDYGDYVAWPSKDAKMHNMQRLFDNHKKIGFNLLLDEHVIIEKDGDKIALIGVENWGIGFGKRGNLNKALNGLPKNMFKILMSHDPSHWDHEVKNNSNKIHLTFSGHTHGMQMGIELFGWKWSPVKLRYKKWAGLYDENNRYLYINRGFGFLGFAGRVGIWPEVTKITLRKKK